MHLCRCKLTVTSRDTICIFVCAEEAMMSGAAGRGNCAGLTTTEKRHSVYSRKALVVVVLRGGGVDWEAMVLILYDSGNVGGLL